MIQSLIIIPIETYLQVRKLSEPEKLIRPIGTRLSDYQQQVLADHRDWLAANGFALLTTFQFASILAAVFQHLGTQRYFSFYFSRKLSFDIVSAFSDTTGFTTGTSGSIGMFPSQPGSYKQSFPNAIAEQAWQRHMAGEAYLMQKFGVGFQPLKLNYEQRVAEVIRGQMQYVRSLPFYPFRAIHWYHINRGRMANLPVQKQYP